MGLKVCEIIGPQTLDLDYLFRDSVIGFPQVVDIFGVIRVFGSPLFGQLVFCEHRELCDR